MSYQTTTEEASRRHNQSWILTYRFEPYQARYLLLLRDVIFIYVSSTAITDPEGNLLWQDDHCVSLPRPEVTHLPSEPGPDGESCLVSEISKIQGPRCKVRFTLECSRSRRSRLWTSTQEATIFNQSHRRAYSAQRSIGCGP